MKSQNNIPPTDASLSEEEITHTEEPPKKDSDEKPVKPELTDPIAADIAAADDDYIMSIVNPIFPDLDDEDASKSDASESNVLHNKENTSDADKTADLEKIVDDASLTQDLSAVAAQLQELAHVSSKQMDETSEPTSIKDVTDTFSSYLRSRRRALFRFIRHHSLVSSLLIIAILASLSALIVFFIRVSNVPSTETVIADARTRAITPHWEPGKFDADESLLLTGIEVTSRLRTTTAISSDAAQFGATGYASAETLLTYSGNSIIALKRTTFGYANTHGWNPIGNVEDQSISYQATSGVSTSRVIDAIQEVLQKYDEQNPQQGMTLYDQFNNATFSVVDAGFDRSQQTCWVKMKGISTTLYGTSTCEITASFTFDSSTGHWILDSVSSTTPISYDYSALVGTWKGSFISCEASSGSPCYAGKNTPLTLTVQSANFSHDQLTLSASADGVMHNHGSLAESYRWHGGDVEFKGAPLTLTTAGTIEKNIQVSGELDLSHASLTSTTDAHKSASSKTPQVNINFDTVHNSVTAQVISTYTENGQTVTFTDTYQLTKE